MAAFGHSESRRDRARDQSGLSLARPSGCVFPRCVKKMGLQPNKSPCKCFAGAFYFRLGAYNDMSGDGSSRQMPLQVLLRFGDSAQKVSKPKSESRMRPNRLFAEISELPRHVRRALCLSISGFSVFWAKKVLSCLSPRIPTGAFLYRALRRIP